MVFMDFCFGLWDGMLAGSAWKSSSSSASGPGVASGTGDRSCGLSSGRVGLSSSSSSIPEFLFFL